MMLTCLFSLLPLVAVALRSNFETSESSESANGVFNQADDGVFSIEKLMQAQQVIAELSADSRSSASQSLDKPGTTHEIVSCQDFCVQCEHTGKTWKVKRATSAFRKIGVGAFVVGAVSLGLTALVGSIATGTTAAWIAGAPVVLFKAVGLGAAGAMSTGAGVAGAITATGWMGIMGGMGCGYVLRDQLMHSRRCPNVNFRSEDKSDKADGKHKFGAKYYLEDVYFIELVDQMKVKPEKTANKIKVLSTGRDDLPEQERLSSLMACSVLTQAQNKFAYMGVQLPDMANLTKKFGGISEAVVAACGKWLCVEKSPARVYKPSWISRKGFYKC